MSPNPLSRLGAHLIGYAGLLGTPWLIFFSTALPLYLNNRTDLHDQAGVLIPYLLLVFVTGLLFLPLRQRAIGSRTSVLSRTVLWLYYLSGVVFIGVLSVGAATTGLLKVASVSAILITGLLVAQFLARRAELKSFTTFFALATMAFVAVDIPTLWPAPATPPVHSETAKMHEYHSGPNVYHLLLDEYQGDIFDKTLDEDRRETLAGFTLYPDTTTPFGRTSMALPGIFTGRSFDYASTQIGYKKEGMNGPASLLHSLKEAGYVTEGYLFPIMPFELTLFDSQQFHETTSTYDPAKISELFNKLWLISTLPSIAKLVLPANEFEGVANRMVMDPDSPLTSLRVFRQFLAEEAAKPPTGRYVFVHLILPHFPNVLDEDCNYSEASDVLTQSHCATQLVLEMVDRLRDLDRFHGSLVIVHSDHGSSYQIKEDGSFVNVEPLGWYSTDWSRSRSKSMLLLKPPNASGDPLIEDRTPASLLDIAPTLRAMLQLPEVASDGYDLFNTPPDPNRVRYYHFYDQKGGSGWTDELTRYRITGDTIEKDELIPLPNNPVDF